MKVKTRSPKSRIKALALLTILGGSIAFLVYYNIVLIKQILSKTTKVGIRKVETSNNNEFVEFDNAISSHLMSIDNNNDNNGESDNRNNPPSPATQIRADEGDAAANLKPLIATPTTHVKGKNPPPRIYCMIPTMYNRNKLDQLTAIMKTWGPACDVIKFFVEPHRNAEGAQDNSDIPPYMTVPGLDFKVEIVILTDFVRIAGNPCATGAENPDGTPEYTPCKHIWEKVWRSWVYVAKHDSELADFFFKIDDDTYFIPEAMRETLRRKKWTPDEQHYFGAVIYPHGPKYGMVAGALAGFSRKTLLSAATKYSTMEHEYGDRTKFRHGRCVDRDGATEEVTTSRCLKELKIYAEPIRDELKRTRILVWTPPTMLTYKRKNVTSSWFYKDQPYDVGTEENCCSTLPVGFHFLKDPTDIIRIHDLLVDPEGKNEIEEIVRTKVPEWEVVLKENPEKRLRGIIFKGEVQPPLAAIRFAQYFLAVKNELKNYII